MKMNKILPWLMPLAFSLVLLVPPSALAQGCG
jgi:hypothetical protein